MNSLAKNITTAIHQWVTDKLTAIRADIVGVLSVAESAFSKANAAQSTADSAVSAAESAQSTADSAVSAAASAQSTADSAVSAAASAQSTADSAASSAESAQSTADSAVSAAASAQSAADKAQSSADKAQSAADAAKSAAENAQNTADNAKAEVESVGSDKDALIQDMEQAVILERKGYNSIPLLCGQPMILFGAGTPQESIVPTNWIQFNPETGEGYNWNGTPSAEGQTYINTAADTNGHYTAVKIGYNLIWKPF